MNLVEIAETGSLSADLELSPFFQEVIEATVSHYRQVGFIPPWIGYIGAENGVGVGVCGFKSCPENGRVEIAYGTAPGYEGQGVATSLAKQLVQIVRNENKALTIVAQTLPEENASTSILKNLGFRKVRSVVHPEDGLVWEWELRE